jgi:hypothetical protein
MLLSAQMASADQLIAYLQVSSLPNGTESYDCTASMVNSSGTRAHMQAAAQGQLLVGTAPIQYSTQAGTSQGESVGAHNGIKHRAFLQSHMLDFVNGADKTITYCPGSWTSGWNSSGTTNVSSCSANVTSSINKTNGQGSCFLRQYGAASMGNSN